MDVTAAPTRPARIPAAAVEDSVARRFERQVATCPDALAVQDRRGALSYRELNARANGIARALRRLLDDDPRPVAMLLGHDASAAAGVLGALKAGAIASPLDVRHPPARLAALVELSDAPVIVTDERHAELARSVSGRRATVLSIEEAGSNGTDADLGRTIGPGAPAYLVYTSGTTGPPKGVLHSHRNLLHRVYALASLIDLRPGDRHTWFASASVGQGASTIFHALLSGGALFPHSPRERGLHDVPDWLRRERMTCFNSSATLFRTLVALLREGDRFPDMRVVRLGSERVRHDDVRAFARHFPASCLFVNQLSSTETSGICMCRIRNAADVAEGSVPIGHPLPDQHVHLLDDEGREVPTGAVGEIAVRGRFLALGYWRDPELTAARFRPVESAPGERIYLTGDLGRVRPDGQLEHLGRKDARVKVRGVRIELEEIEWVLRQCPGVAQAAAGVSQAHDGEDLLVAYYVAAPGTMAAEEVRAFLAERLPPLAMPAWFVRVDSLPLTPSGKIDRQSLPGPGSLEDAESGTAPRSDLERALADLWSEVLGPRPVGVHDVFFDRGGDSLRATRVLARVLERYEVEVSMAEFMGAPTIAALAETIERRRAEALAEEAVLLQEVLDELEGARSHDDRARGGR